MRPLHNYPPVGSQMYLPLNDFLNTYFQYQINRLKIFDYHIFLWYTPLSSIASIQEMSMGFKKAIRNLDFAHLAMATCLEQNRSIKFTQLNVACTLQFAF
jgi:hypothetical protein